MNRYFRYFKNPLQGISSFTAYRLPNSVIHMPVILMSAYAGVSVCGPEAGYLLPVYFVIALYMGRDLVAFSYNRRFMPALTWAVFAPFLYYRDKIAASLSFQSVSEAANITAIVFCAFFIYTLIYSQHTSE